MKKILLLSSLCLLSIECFSQNIEIEDKINVLFIQFDYNGKYLYPDDLFSDIESNTENAIKSALDDFYNIPSNSDFFTFSFEIVDSISYPEEIKLYVSEVVEKGNILDHHILFHNTPNSLLNKTVQKFRAEYNANIVVVVANSFSKEIHNNEFGICGNVNGLGTIGRFPEQGTTVYGPITIRGGGEDFDLSTFSEPLLNNIKEEFLPSLFLHEFGHNFGLIHTLDPADEDYFMQENFNSDRAMAKAMVRNEYFNNSATQLMDSMIVDEREIISNVLVEKGWISVNETTSIYGIENSKINIFPNPITSTLNIDITNNNNSLFEVSIYNLNGQTIISDRKVRNSISIDLSKQPSSVYLLEITDTKTGILCK